MKYLVKLNRTSLAFALCALAAGVSVPAAAEGSGSDDLTPYERRLACSFSNTCSDEQENGAAPADEDSQIVDDERPFQVYNNTSRTGTKAAAKPINTASTAQNRSGPKLYTGGSSSSRNQAPSGDRARSQRLAQPARVQHSSPRRTNAADMNVLFGNASAELDASSKSEVRSWKNVFESAGYKGLRVRIEGHTNSVGDRAYNMALSQQRAEAVRNYMVSIGFDSARIDAVGYGFDKPRTRNGKDSANRRVEIVKAD